MNATEHARAVSAPQGSPWRIESSGARPSCRPYEEERAEARAWVDATRDRQRPLAEWRDLLVDSGLACRWPRPRCSSTARPSCSASCFVASPRDATRGARLFSEPSNGSDLAGLTTHARRDGDEWFLTGQKVWTTGAHHAAYGMLLARTDPDVPKHRGISFLVFPMRQAGAEVRQLREMNRRASFNEVSLAEARVPHANRVGTLHGGWAVGRTTLSHERPSRSGSASPWTTATSRRPADRPG